MKPAGGVCKNPSSRLEAGKARSVPQLLGPATPVGPEPKLSYMNRYGRVVNFKNPTRVGQCGRPPFTTWKFNFDKTEKPPMMGLACKTPAPNSIATASSFFLNQKPTPKPVATDDKKCVTAEHRPLPICLMAPIHVEKAKSRIRSRHLFRKEHWAVPMSNENDRIECNLCGEFICTRPMYSLRHIRNHAAQKQFTCPNCDYASHAPKIVVAHMQHAHSQRGQPLENVTRGMREQWHSFGLRCFPQFPGLAAMFIEADDADMSKYAEFAQSVLVAEGVDSEPPTPNHTLTQALSSVVAVHKPQIESSPLREDTMIVPEKTEEKEVEEDKKVGVTRKSWTARKDAEEKEGRVSCVVCGETPADDAVVVDRTSPRLGRLIGQLQLPPQTRYGVSVQARTLNFSSIHFCHKHFGDNANIANKEEDKPSTPSPHKQVLLKKEPDGKLVYTCKIKECGRRVICSVGKEVSALVSHAKSHAAYKQFACPLCSYESLLVRNVFSHMRAEHPACGMRRRPLDRLGMRLSLMWRRQAAVCFPDVFRPLKIVKRVGVRKSGAKVMKKRKQREGTGKDKKYMPVLSDRVRALMAARKAKLVPIVVPSSVAASLPPAYTANVAIQSIVDHQYGQRMPVLAAEEKSAEQMEVEAEQAKKEQLIGKWEKEQKKRHNKRLEASLNKKVRKMRATNINKEKAERKSWKKERKKVVVRLRKPKMKKHPVEKTSEDKQIMVDE